MANGADVDEETAFAIEGDLSDGEVGAEGSIIFENDGLVGVAAEGDGGLLGAKIEVCLVVGEDVDPRFGLVKAAVDEGDIAEGVLKWETF